MVKLCIFDMDGLLIDSERVLYLNNGMEISKKLGYPLSEEFLRSLMGCNWKLYAEKILEHKGKDFPIDEYLNMLFERIEDVLNNGSIPLMKGTKELLDYCKDHNIKMAVATSTPKDKAIRCLDNAGIKDYFDYVVCGDMVEKGKPEPDIYLSVVDHFKIDLDKLIVLEDGHSGSLAARRANCRLIIVEDLANVEKQDRDYAELLPSSLLEVIDYIDKENERTFSA